MSSLIPNRQHRFRRLVVLLAALVLPCAARAGAPTIDAMREHRRIVLIVAPGKNDAAAGQQRAILAHWRSGAVERDISVIDVAGSAVTGVSDDGAALRHRYHLDGATFHVLLIGKDGHVALRSSTPVPAARLQQTIDAMPMRQAGER